MAVANRLAPRTQKTGLTAYLTQDAVKDQINKVVGGQNGTRFISSIVSAVQATPALTEGRRMIVHVVSPTKVRLMSALDGERKREVLFETDAQVSGFHFDQWYDQESFMISLQANFAKTADLDAVLLLAGNIERKNEQTYSDDGCTQVATMTVGVAAKADAIVPNPVQLRPYRTFQEVEQPVSQFVFRIGDRGTPEFKLVEAEGGIWKTEAVRKIKDYLELVLSEQDMALRNRITIIG